jgi:hypothetical protein
MILLILSLIILPFFGSFVVWIRPRSPPCPTTPEILKGIIGTLTREQERFCQEIELLREQIHLLIAKRFGPSSEKTAPRDNPQLPLFDLPEPAEIEPAPEIVEVPAHSRRKRGRKPLPASLPRSRWCMTSTKRRSSVAAVHR